MVIVSNSRKKICKGRIGEGSDSDGEQWLFYSTVVVLLVVFLVVV